VADGDFDPRYAARFRRDYDPSGETEPLPPSGLELEPAAPAESGRGTGVALLVVAGLLAATGAAAAAWIVLDPAFTVPPDLDRLASARRVAGALPGPLAVGFVVATAVGLLTGTLPRRAALAVSLVLAVAPIVLVVRVSAEAARLAALTANGPVSSGGIPLPEPGMTNFFERIRTIEVLEELLPWIVLAAALAIVAAVVVTGRLLSRRVPT
jgi:hypothetical protein